MFTELLKLSVLHLFRVVWDPKVCFVNPALFEDGFGKDAPFLLSLSVSFEITRKLDSR